MPLTRDALSGSIPDQFRSQASIHAGRPAVRFDGREITYSELAARSARLAAAIAARTGESGRAVVVLVPQGIDQVVAILGILESGGWYVPLDLGGQAGTLRDLAVRAEAALVVATASTSALAAEVAPDGCDILTIGGDAGEADLDRVLDRLGHRRPPAADDLAYVYFTSGTTGPPKGVMDSQRNVLHNILRYTRALGWTHEDRFTLLQPAHFSGAVSNVFGALLNGGLLLPYDVGRDGAGGPLVRWMKEERPTLWHSVPSLFRSICVPEARYPEVRVVRLEGDAAVPADAERFQAHFSPDARLAHGLGATETGLSCQHILRAGEGTEGDVLPVGGAVDDVELRLVDERGAPVPTGGVGEIVVASRYLALGYWRDPERNALAFRADPSRAEGREYHTGDLGRRSAEGLLEHLGRLDHQLRVRGQWVDAAAVESRLARLPGVIEARVAIHRDGRDEAVLAAYLVLDSSHALTLAGLRGELRNGLPAHAIPTRAYVLEAMPVGSVGKHDRRALHPHSGKPLATGTRSDPPRDRTEAAIGAIWREVLELEDIGVHDEFVALGGDSLKAIQVAIAIERRLHLSVGPGQLADSPTIASLASRLRAGTVPAARRSPLAIRANGAGSPLICVPDLESGPLLFGPLARRLESRPIYAVRYPSGVPAVDLPRTLAELAARTIEELEAILPAGIQRLAGFCFGGAVALEMARQLAARGRPVATLALINVTPFDLLDRVSPRARRRFRVGWADRIRYLLRKPDAARWIATRVGRTAQDMGWRAALPAARALLPATAGPEITRATLLEAFRRHRSAAHAGPVELFLAEETLSLYSDDPAEAWGPLATGRVRIHVFPRDGYLMLQEPDVGRLAGLLDAALGDGARG